MIDVQQLPEGMRFRLARTACGLTLFDVGSQANVSPQRLSEYELGRSGLADDAAKRVWSVLNAHAASEASVPKSRCDIEVCGSGRGTSDNHDTAA